MHGASKMRYERWVVCRNNPLSDVSEPLTTVDTYKARIGQKLGLTHRTDYVRIALRLGLIGDAGSQQNADDDSHLRRQSGL